MEIEDVIKYYHTGITDRGGCGGPVMTVCIIFLLFVFSACSTTKEIKTEEHSYTNLVEKMDSMMHSTTTWQQDFLSRQTSLIETFKQKEKNDSSHTVVVNEKGDTVREKIIIYKEVSTDHSSEKEEKEMWMQKFQEIDSLLKVSLDKQAETDSLLKENQTEVEVPAELSWWQKLRLWLGNIMLIGIIGLVGYGGWRAYKVVRLF